MVDGEGQTGDRFRHEALMYSGDTEFVRRAASFVRSAIEAGEPVMVMVSNAKIDQLRERLNGVGDDVHFADMRVVGENPARIIPAWQDFVDRHATSTSGLRGIGEPIWAGRSAPELAECHLHESLLNVAFASGPPFWLLCLHDTSTLPPSVIEEAARHHPVVVDGDGRAGDLYQPMDAACALAGTRLPPPPHEVVPLEFAGRAALGDVRRTTEQHVRGAGLSAEREADFVLAVNELAANSMRHGGGTGTLWLWNDDQHVYGEVHDRGYITEPLVGRVRPSLRPSAGRGLWMTNQLCELVQIRSAPGNTVVRLRMTRGNPAATAAESI